MDSHSVCQPAKTYTSAVYGHWCTLEDLPGVTEDWNGERKREERKGESERGGESPRSSCSQHDLMIISEQIDSVFFFFILSYG